MKFVYSLCLVSLFKYSANQYVTLNRKPTKSSSCDGPNKTALVEHFFNIIFAEFHSTPPICVCVQMCIEQSTYCYPNGCFKRQNQKNKRTDSLQPMPRLSTEDKPMMFVVDEKNDFMTDFFKKIDVIEPRIVNEETKPLVNNMRPDPFKDRYKMIYKYKKVPKVELRYNLREQVKNTKSDILKIESMDVSKTRWPLNKDKRVNRKKIYADINNPKNPSSHNANFFLSIHPDSDVTNYPSKYFKRDLSRRAEDEVNIKAVYIVENKDEGLENGSFSIETLIDNLIESNFEKNETEADPKMIKDSNEQGDGIILSNVSSNERQNRALPTEEQHLELHPNKTILLNVTNDSENYNYDDIAENKTTSFNEMIASLSKRIEQQNHASIAIMKKVIGDKVLKDVDLLETDNAVETTTKTETVGTNFAAVTPEYTQLPIDYSEMKTTTKSRQRISRKLHHSKMN